MNQADYVESIPVEEQSQTKKSKQKEKNNKGDISSLSKFTVITIFILSVIGMFYINTTIKGRFEFYMGIYGTLMITYLLFKMSLSFFYKPTPLNYDKEKITVVIPSYNETSDSVINTIESILHQDYPIYEIIFVDDGSDNLKEFLAVKNRYSSKNNLGAVRQTPNRKNDRTPIIVHRLERNMGKRHAQAWAFKRAKGDIIVTVDSDAYIYPDAIGSLVAPFKNKKVKATTGHVNARNKNDNLFTKLIDMRYDNAFRVERSAQSVCRNILVCSGCFSAYRREVIMKNIEHYENQSFLGEKVQFGDDRCLTNYAILEGDTVYQSTARCETDVPSTIAKFLKQQVRWNKSFFRESLIAMKIGMKKPNVLIWSILEMALWIMFGIAIIVGVLLKSKSLGLIMIVYYLAYISLSAYARNVFYILKHPHIFLLSPLYGMIHLLLLLPLRLYSLITIRNNGWGTR